MNDQVAVYLAEHPDATITEVALNLGISVQEARVAMASQRRASLSETTSGGRNARQKRLRSNQPAVEPLTNERLGRVTSEWIASLFRNGIVMDVLGAAEYLGIERGSVEMAVSKGKLSCVRFRNKKLFVRSDLDDYKQHRAPGKASRLGRATVHRV